MKITQNPTFTHNVPVMTPIDGGFEEETLNTTFNYLDTKAVASFDLKTAEGTTAFLNAAVARFHDLTDEKLQPVAYSDQVRDLLFARHGVRQALCTYYFEAITKVKTGN